MDRVITSNLVIRHAFILTGIIVLIKAFSKFIFQRSESTTMHVLSSPPISSLLASMHCGLSVVKETISSAILIVEFVLRR